SKLKTPRGSKVPRLLSPGATFLPLERLVAKANCPIIICITGEISRLNVTKKIVRDSCARLWAATSQGRTQCKRSFLGCMGSLACAAVYCSCLHTHLYFNSRMRHTLRR